MKNKKPKLYWVTDAGALEDWFVIAYSAKQAERFYARQEFGESPRAYGVEAEELMEIPINLLEGTKYDVMPCWVDLDILIKLGFKVINEESPIRVRHNDLIYKEGKMQGNLEKLTKYFYGAIETESLIDEVSLDFRKIHIGNILAFDDDIRPVTMDDMAAFYIERQVPGNVHPIKVNGFSLTNCLNFIDADPGEVEFVISDKEKYNDFYTFQDRLLLVFREGEQWRDEDLEGFFIDIERLERKPLTEENISSEDEMWEATTRGTYKLGNIKYLHQVQNLINSLEEGFVDAINLALLGFSYEKKNDIEDLDV